jgi:methylated-DNA-[protein]-cysteine S-methyltransferase
MAWFAILWEKNNPRRVHLEDHRENAEHPILVQTERELSDYFAGKRRQFTVSLDI